MTEFYVIMQKRSDGVVYPDLHKTTQSIYLTEEDAREELNNNPFWAKYFHVVKLIASLPNDRFCYDQSEPLERGSD